MLFTQTRDVEMSCWTWRAKFRMASMNTQRSVEQRYNSSSKTSKGSCRNSLHYSGSRVAVPGSVCRPRQSRPLLCPWHWIRQPGNRSKAVVLDGPGPVDFTMPEEYDRYIDHYWSGSHVPKGG